MPCFTSLDRARKIAVLGMSAVLWLFASDLQAQFSSRTATATAAATSVFPYRVAFTDEKFWENEKFLSSWLPRESPTQLCHKTFNGKGEFYGHEPHFITGLFNDEKLVSISIVFLDSGTWFGYVPGGKDAPGAEAKQKQFNTAYSKAVRDIADGLRDLSGKRGEKTTLGEEAYLRQEIQVYSHGDNFSRFTAIEGHLAKVTLYRSREEATSNLAIDYVDVDRRDLEERFKARVVDGENGDRKIDEIPLFPQGNRAYCGVSTLAMAMQYMGSSVETEDYAAAAGIEFGSARGAKVREVYHAAAKEAGLRMSRATKFDFRRAQESIDNGIPVVVWRRFSFDRDYLHTAFAKRYAADQTVELPKPDLNDEATWPGKDAPAHASIINGYNSERGEVIFTESWGDYVRDRRMRVEELEGTAYYSFYLRH